MRYILVFIVGLLFGSFGSVILHRLGDNITRKKIQSVLIGRSHCPHCEHTLARYDLFPLLSRLLTRGKCRYCGVKVSHWYPLLEMGSGLVFLGVFYWWSTLGGGEVSLLIILLFLHRSLYLLMVHDIKTMYLHPIVRRMSLIWGILLVLYNTPWENLIGVAPRIIVFWIWFLLIYRLARLYVRLRRKQRGEWIGQGDVMIAPIVGVVLRKAFVLHTGVLAVSWLVIIQMFRYYVVIACLASLLLLIVTPISKEGGKRLIPFFPGMIVGMWIVIIGLSRFVETLV